MPAIIRRAPPAFLLGGYQTDFARDVSAEGLGLRDLLKESLGGALQAARLEPRDVEAVHVANWAGELLNQQGHLGALVGEAEPALAGLPTGRHEAAGASGGVAVQAAMAELEAGRYDVVMVVGVELLRGEPEVLLQGRLAVALRADEAHGQAWPFARVHSELAEEYERRYGLRPEHLRVLGESSLRAAARNPRALRRGPQRPAREDREEREGREEEAVLARFVRRRDASPPADGAVALVLASERYAGTYARRRGLSLSRLPRISGWGHRTARLSLRARLRDGGEHVLPELRGALTDALLRASLSGPEQLNALECHDSFTIAHYAIIDHLGLAPAGQPWRLIEDGSVLAGGRLATNPSGGLLGVGHAGGASGVRMVLDAARQVSDGAGDYQVPDASRVAVINVGGAMATVATFVVESTRARPVPR